jgi:microcystin-dependent protein
MDADSTSTNTEVLYQSTIRCNLTSKNAPQVFQVNEFGVFASLNNQAPFLFAYSSTGAPTGDTVDPSTPIVKEYVLPILYSTLQQVTASIAMTDVVGLHASTHLSSGIDPLPISNQTISGLCPKTPNDTAQVLIGSTTAAFSQLPLHGPTHVSSGRDPVPIATTQATGLLVKLSGDPATVLKGDGTWGTNFAPGCVIDYAGTAATANWLLCDGHAYSRTQYAALFAVLGGASSPWGVGDGVSTFNVPDLRGRVLVGAGLGAGLTNRAIGARGGEETHTLSVYELPAHNHPVIENPHTHTATSPDHTHGVYDPKHVHAVNDPTHAHNYTDPTHQHPLNSLPSTSGGAGGVPGVITQQPGPTDATYYAAVNITILDAATGITTSPAATQIQIYAASTTVTVASAKTNVQTGNTGSGGAHNNLQPFAVLNKIIHI